MKFNRKLNIKSFTRTLANGKTIRVAPHSRKAAVLRAREALQELAKSKTEAGYVVSKSGKLSKKISQNAQTSISYRLKGKELGARKGIVAKLHSHNLPKNNLTAYPPSVADITNSLKTQKIGAVISAKDGSMFRYSAGQKLDKALPLERKALVQKLEKEMREFQAKTLKQKDLTGEQKILALDNYFQDLSKQKLIRYRSRPSEKFKQAREKFKDV
jgi:hypothetical protein